MRIGRTKGGARWFTALLVVACARCFPSRVPVAATMTMTVVPLRRQLQRARAMTTS